MLYGARLLFDGVDLQLDDGKRYALVGANGTGKTTLLRLITNQETPSLGEIVVPKRSTIGWMRQDQFLHEKQRILDVVLMGKPLLWKALQGKETLLQGTWTDKAAFSLAALEETIAQQDGYFAESFAHTLLTGLGLPQENHKNIMSTLSGGYKLRVLLAQALFEEPDILLLDEPTNHLDIMTITWLEKYLMNKFSGLLVFISHDLRFINNVATDILDIDYGEIRDYTGTYSHFLQKKEEIMSQKLQEKAHIEAKIQHMQSFVDKFKAKASKAKQAKSRVKMIDKLTLPDIKHSSRKKPAFHFEPQRPSGKNVLTLSKLSKSFGEKKVLSAVEFEVNRNEKIAILGHNGIGKSTLLKIALGLIPCDLGTAVWGYETHVAYFAQDHHELLNDNQTVEAWLTHHASKVPQTTIRNTLGQILFEKDDVEKNILQISGGEAARLLFGRIMLAKPNVLVLDEPTNHLDIEGISALIEALQSFKGTIICVSHDRYFVSKIATRIIAFTEDGINDYPGSYSAYLKHYGEDYLSQAFLAAHSAKSR